MNEDLIANIAGKTSSHVRRALNTAVERTYSDAFHRAVPPRCSPSVVEAIRNRSTDRASEAVNGVARSERFGKRMLLHITDAVLAWYHSLPAGSHLIDADSRAFELAAFVIANKGEEDFRATVEESVRAALGAVADSVLDMEESVLARAKRLEVAEAVLKESDSFQLRWEDLL